MIPVGHISTLGRIRRADAKQVAALAQSIKEVGLLNPITVAPARIVFNGQQIDGYQLVAGLHRLEACKSLGMTEVAVTLVDLGEQQRIIAECDENLMRSDSASDRALFTARRKEAYETLHPETGHGKSSPIKEDKLSSFDRDQAEKTGVDARTVRRAAERGEKVCPGAMDLIRGTRLDTGVYLDQIKKLDPAAQVERVTTDLRPKPQKPVDMSGVRRSKIDADVKDRAAREVAEIIAEHVPADLWDGVKANLYAAGANTVAHALTNITGQSLMDKAEWT